MDIKYTVSNSVYDYYHQLAIDIKNSWSLDNFYQYSKDYFVTNHMEDFIDFLCGLGMNFISSEHEFFFYDNNKKIGISFSKVNFNNKIHKDVTKKNLKFFGERKFVKEYDSLIKNQEKDNKTKEVLWYYPDASGSILTNYVPLKRNKNFIKEFYPFIEDVDTWIDDFYKSDSNVLLLIGPPGTGKSSLIKEMLSRTERTVSLTYDETLIKQDSFYISLLDYSVNSNNPGVIVLEDADTLLMDRESSGNSAMSKLLNMSDGIIDPADLKFIFTANLDNVNQIDHALTRPGRCYDIVEFRKLTYDEAEIAAKKAEITLNNDLNKFSVAEIYNQKQNRSEKSKIGF